MSHLTNEQCSATLRGDRQIMGCEIFSWVRTIIIIANAISFLRIIGKQDPMSPKDAHRWRLNLFTLSTSSLYPWPPRPLVCSIQLRYFNLSLSLCLSLYFVLCSCLCSVHHCLSVCLVYCLLFVKCALSHWILLLNTGKLEKWFGLPSKRQWGMSAKIFLGHFFIFITPSATLVLDFQAIKFT